MTDQSVDAEAVTARADVVRRALVGLRVTDPQELADLTQETLARVLEVRGRLTPDVLDGYLLAVARNTVVSEKRRRDLEQRHLPRLLDLDVGNSAAELVEQAEEWAALRAALDRLPAGERDLLLLRQSVSDGPTVDGATAARLARARARLRVEYVLALRRVDLPAERCRQVLLALSGGQQRRQRTVRAEEHLLACVVCALIAPALLERSRRLAAGPFAVLGASVAALLASLRALLSGRRAQQVALVSTSAVLVAAVTVASTTTTFRHPPNVGAGPTSAAEQYPVTRAGGLAPAFLSSVATHVGEHVLLRSVHVQSVPADEGFWVGDGGARLWVQLALRGESGPTVRAGDRLTLDGQLHRVDAGFPARVGLTDAEGAPQLLRQGVYLDVPIAGLHEG